MCSPCLIRRCLTALALLLPVLLGAEVVAVNSQVFNGYARQQSSEGTFAPEAYTFGEGGCWSRAIKDPWMEKLTFMDVAHAVAGPLAKINFRPALPAGDAQLLIMVYWGSTQGSIGLDQNDLINQASAAGSAYNRALDADHNDSTKNKLFNLQNPESAAYETFLWRIATSNQMRDDLDDRNARILGYSEALSRARFAVQFSSSGDILRELGGNRYYVVLQAYDFKKAAKEKKLYPLWTTRLSVAEDGEFTAALDRMAANGSRYFGRATEGLRRERTGTVDLAPVKIIEAVPTKTEEVKGK